MGSLCLSALIETLKMILVYCRNNSTAKLSKLENLLLETETIFILMNIKNKNEYSVVNIALINL